MAACHAPKCNILFGFAEDGSGIYDNKIHDDKILTVFQLPNTVSASLALDAGQFYSSNLRNSFASGTSGKLRLRSLPAKWLYH
jgi:hypothetical protein